MEQTQEDDERQLKPFLGKKHRTNGKLLISSSKVLSSNFNANK